MNVLQWFTRSCDLSPADNLWHYLKTALHKHVKPVPAPEDHNILIRHKSSISKLFMQKNGMQKIILKDKNTHYTKLRLSAGQMLAEHDHDV